MSMIANALNQIVPIRESRRVSGTVAAVNGTVTMDLNGDNSATIQLVGGGGTVNLTYIVEGTLDGSYFFLLPMYAYLPACTGGTLPVPAQPMLLEALNVADPKRVVCVATSGLAQVRVRVSAYTAGSVLITMVSDTEESLNPYVRSQRSATLGVTATAAVSTVVNASLPAVTGLRHYIDSIRVIRSATAALTASATPVLVTTSNLPGNPVLTFGSDVAGIGLDKELVLDFGGSGLAATAISSTTIVSAPAYTGVIWRINVIYRLGI